MWWARQFLVPMKATPGCPGDSCASIMGYVVNLTPMVTSRWQLVDHGSQWCFVHCRLIFLFVTVHSIYFVLFITVASACLYILLWMWTYMWNKILIQLLLLPTSLKAYIHFLSLPSYLSSFRRSVGFKRSRREPEETWRMKNWDYSSSRSDTHTRMI